MHVAIAKNVRYFPGPQCTDLPVEVNSQTSLANRHTLTHWLDLQTHHFPYEKQVDV